MTRNFKYSTVLAGIMGFSTLILFHQGAQALDLSDFSGADQTVITKDAPKAGGIVLVKEDIVYPKSPSRVQTTIVQPQTAQQQQLQSQQVAGSGFAAPMLTAPSSTGYNNITPAAGGDTPITASNYRGGDGSTGAPGKGIDGKVDVTTRPGNAFDQAQAKFNGTAPSDPVDGKPLTTTTLANGARVDDLNAVVPAAGSAQVQAQAQTPATAQSRMMTAVSVDGGKSVAEMTGRGHGPTYNN